MKRIIMVLGICLVLIGVMAAPALAAAQKVGLTAYDGTGETGSGFVIFNNPQGSHNLDFAVSLKGGVPSQGYYAYLNVDGSWVPPYTPGSYVGSGIANKQGNVDIHVNYTISSGAHAVWVQLCNASGGTGYYFSDTATMTFK